MARQTKKPAASNIARRRAAARDDGKDAYLERRQKIVRAAADVFKQRGFRGTTLAHVAEAMAVDRASLYYYVGSKDELFHEIVTEAVKRNLATAIAVSEEEISAPEKLSRIVGGLMASYSEYYPFLYVFIQENLNHVSPGQSDWAEEMKQVNREYERALIEIVKAGQREGTLSSTAPPWLVAYGILGMVGWTSRWFNPRESPVSAEEVGGAFVDTLLNGLMLPAPTAGRQGPAAAKSTNGARGNAVDKPKPRAKASAADKAKAPAKASAAGARTPAKASAAAKPPKAPRKATAAGEAKAATKPKPAPKPQTA